MGWREFIYDHQLTITGVPSGADTNYSGSAEKGFFELPGVGGDLPAPGDIYKDFSSSTSCPDGIEYPGIVVTDIVYTKQFVHPESIGIANGTSINGRKAIVKYSSEGASGGNTPAQADASTIIRWSGQTQFVTVPTNGYDGWFGYFGEELTDLPAQEDLNTKLEYTNLPYTVPAGSISVTRRLQVGELNNFISNFVAKAGEINEEELFNLPIGHVLLSTFDTDPRKDEFGRDRVFVTLVYLYKIIKYGWNGIHSLDTDRVVKPVLRWVSPGAGPSTPRNYMYNYGDISIDTIFAPTQDP